MEHKCDYCGKIFLDEPNAAPICPECLENKIGEILEELGNPLIYDGEEECIWFPRGTFN